MSEKFQARGIRKDGTFVYGYPFYDKFEKKWLMLLEDLLENYHKGEVVSGLFAEIIKAPDRCLDFKDKNGKMLYEGDDFFKIVYTNKLKKERGNAIKTKYNLHFVKELHRICAVTKSGGGFCFSISCFKSKDIEIIGNSHNIKEL